MSENSKNRDLSTAQQNPISSMALTSGQLLKQARLDAGLHIAALAVSLKVPVKRIEALENGNMDLLPDMVFVRALTSSICQALKIDAAPILDKLPKAALPKLNHHEVAINRPIGASTTGKTSVFHDLIQSAWFIFVILLCLGAAAIYFWPKISSISLPEIGFLQKSSPEVGISQAKVEQVPTESLVVPNLSASTSLGGGTVPNATPENTTAPETATSVVKNNLVTFKASGQTWVEVKNASGGTIFKKLLNDGDEAGTTGTVPLTVIVGRADATRVEIRGKQLNLEPLTKNNVARFEVN